MFERIALAISALLVLPLALLPFLTADLARSLQELGGPQAVQPPSDIKLESERTGLLGQVLYKFD